MTGVEQTQDRVRRWWRRFPDDSGPLNAVGVLLIGALTIALGLVDLWRDAPWRPGGLQVDGVWHLLPLVLGAAGVLLRRRNPVLSLAIGAVMFGVDLLLGGSLALVLVLFDGLYAVERFGSPSARRVVRSAAGIVTIGTAVAALADGQSLRVALLLTFQTGALLVVPLWWALDVRRRSELADAAHQRADLEAARAAEQARAQQAERQGAVQAERSRMARELHDAVAGDVSALVIRAGAALAAAPGPADRESLAAVRESGLHALQELRAMIEVLADERTEPVAPTLSADGAALLERSGAAVRGAVDDLGPVTPATDRAGFRILQEALTNAAVHGSGLPEVRLTRAADTIEIDVRNAVDDTPRPGDGIGLASMGERAQAVGGALDVVTESGTWRVNARLPAVAS